MAPSPTTLRTRKEQALLEVVWPDERTDQLPYYELRCACPCAVCIDEMTGRQLLRPESVPRDVHPDAMAFVGNYAVRISWSDGHATGIYTWDRLRRMGDELAQRVAS